MDPKKPQRYNLVRSTISADQLRDFAQVLQQIQADLVEIEVFHAQRQGFPEVAKLIKNIAVKK